MQEEEREQSLRMKPVVDHIRAAFKGDERFMIQQAYYRLNNYKPYYVLKSSLSLLLQIPFFIAAYRFLSGLLLLQGQSFGPIPDLGSPDGLIRVAGLSINLLPVLMTAINLLSAVIYTKGMPLSSKLQLYGMALIFLVFLYDSPSGLAFYWLLNNLFSLGKNIFYKLRNPKLALCWLSFASGLALLAAALFRPDQILRMQLILAAAAMLLQLPLFFYYYRKKHPRRAAMSETGDNAVLFYACCLILVILTGLLIPSAVVRASPSEFVDLSAYQSPLVYVLGALLLSLGTFLLWPVIFYKLASPGSRPLFSLAMEVLSAAAVINFMGFGKNYGNMSASLQYDIPLSITRREYLINAALLLAAAVLLVLLWKKGSRLGRVLAVASCIALAGMAGVNIRSIHSSSAELKVQAAQITNEEAALPLSRTGKNVVVFMLDRGIGAFVPYLMQEHPELQQQFAGFTYYPNTISYGGFTNVGAPPLFGGYAYTPEEMNRRDDQPLVSKHNESLLVMPLNFLREGFEVTVCDPSYANYSWHPDLSIFDDYPQIHRYNTIGAFSQKNSAAEHRALIQQRNMFCYSIFRSVPLLFQETVYNNGLYNDANAIAKENWSVQVIDGLSRSTGLKSGFMRAYETMTHLPQMTEVSDAGVNSFLMLTSDTVHEPMLLQEPEYEPRPLVDNTVYDQEHSLRYSTEGKSISLETEDEMVHYQSNMAAFIQLGNWFDFMRENGVYDNTRIILVSDHGRNLGRLFHLELDDSGEIYKDVMMYTSLLMVKDFGAQDFTTDRRFMTNADTPLLAFEGLVNNPVNEATGLPVTDDAKSNPEQHILYTAWSVARNNGNTFLEEEDTHWLTVKNGDPYDLGNWEVVR